MQRLNFENSGLDSKLFYYKINMYLLTEKPILAINGNNNKITDIITNKIVYKDIRRIYLNNNQIKNLEFINEFEKLKSIDLSFNGISEINGKNDSVEHINLCYNGISNLKNIKNFKNLKFLNVNIPDIEDIEELFYNSGTLEELYAVNKGIKLKGLENLNSFKKLKKLRISKESFNISKKYINKAVKQIGFKLETV